MIRPRAARWFEALCARDDTTLALEALARTGAVELEARTDSPVALASTEVQALLARFVAQARRYRAYWPEGALAPSPFPEPASVALARALDAVDRWANEAEREIRVLQDVEAERAEIHYWQRLVESGIDLDLAAAAAAGPVLTCRAIELPPGVELALPDHALSRHVELDGVVHLLVVVPSGAVASIAEQAAAVKARVHEIHPFAVGERATVLDALRRRLAALDDDERGGRERIDALSARHELARELGDAARLHWVVEHVRALDADPLLAWITGWTTDPDGRTLAAALDASRARCILHFPPPPPGRRPPLLLANPWWAKPYEVFTRALGMPSGDEADPSALLVAIVPLLFGYMFGDVGQGLLLALAGWMLRERLPVLRLLIPGGLASAVFGLLFGSVFAVHGALAPLWVDPLADPVTVLAVPVVAGSLLVLAGFALGGVEAFWAGHGRTWLAAEAGQLVAYLGLALAFVRLEALWLVVAGVLATTFGAAIVWRSAGTVAAALGELVERTLQAAINTLSFARVGAFALAHAGLAAAIAGLAATSDSLPVRIAIFALGNVVVIALEALVVSIQTTRLVLFEFCTRFLRGEGRPFRSLPLPPLTAKEI